MLSRQVYGMQARAWVHLLLDSFFIKKKKSFRKKKIIRDERNWFSCCEFRGAEQIFNFFYLFILV